MQLSRFSHYLEEANWFSSRLDKDFYPDFISRLNSKPPGTYISIKRLSSTHKQHQEIDLIISESKTLKEYFVFELYKLTRTGPRIGWFLRSKKQHTAYFLFRHIISPGKGNVESFQMDSISTKNLNDCLSEYGLDRDFLIKTVDRGNQSSTFQDNLFLIEAEKRQINLIINLDRLKAIEPSLINQYESNGDPINKIPKNVMPNQNTLEEMPRANVGEYWKNRRYTKKVPYDGMVACPECDSRLPHYFAECYYCGYTS